MDAISSFFVEYLEYIITLLAVIFFIFTEFFFSGSEIGLVAADKTKIRYQANKGSKASALILKLFRKPEWILSTTLTGTNISVVTGTTIATAMMLELFPNFGDLLTVLIFSPFMLFFGEIVSKGVFQQKADTIAPKIIYPLYIASIIFYPILLVLTTITSIVSKLFGVSGELHSIFTSKEELKMVLDMAKEGSDVHKQERKMIQRLLFKFSGVSAREVMIPLVDLVAVSSKATVREAIANLNQTDFPWVFVYSDRIDLITGYIGYFDLLNMNKEDFITPVVRPVYYIPPREKIHALLVKMQERNINFAVIVDEYGGADGIITIEDILEEVVGDIASGHERRQPLFRKVDKNKCLVNSRAEIDELNRKMPFEMEIPEDDEYVTLGGFMISKLNKIPEEGEFFEFEKHIFTVEKADERAVIEVSIMSKEPLESEDETVK